MDTSTFQNYINSMDIGQLRDHLNIINEAIVAKSMGMVSPPPNMSCDNTRTGTICVNDFVQYDPQFIEDETTMGILQSELESLSLHTSRNKLSVQNKFLAQSTKPYTWASTNGPVINNPLPLGNYPTISALLSKINTKYQCAVNSVLVSYYASGEVTTRLHDDDESCMDGREPICVVSVGAKRKIEFVDKLKPSYRSADLTIEPEHGSIYLMKAGCQTNFLHRVRKDKRVRSGRFCLSFRCFVEPTERNEQVEKMPDVFATPASSTPLSTTVLAKDTTPKDTTPKPVPLPTGMVARNLNAAWGNSGLGYSPFPSSSLDNSKSPGRNSSNEKLCVLFGTSITTGIDSTKMSRGNRTFVNMSYSGARIGDIRDAVNDFYMENSNAAKRVDKIILSFGTNEMKHFNSFAKSVKDTFFNPVCSLVNQIKVLFPYAQIYFQSLLPIRIMFRYDPNSIHCFNHMLINVCKKYGCGFIDCFSDFLDEYAIDINLDLYQDRKWRKIHLSARGLGLLCRHLKRVIYGNVFNPFI